MKPIDATPWPGELPELVEARAVAVDELMLADRALAMAAADRLRAIERLRRLSGEQGAVGDVRSARARELAHRSLRAEVAVALHVSERAADALIGLAASLHDPLAATLEALDEGRISERHARILVEDTADLPAPDCMRLERAALPLAQRLAPPRFRGRLRELRERMLARTAVERHRRARDERGVWVEPGRDGMSWLTAHLPATEAAAIDDRLTRLARRQGARASEERTLTQLRADLLSDALLGATEGEQAAIVPTVHLTVPVLALLGHTNEPARLEGHGPIDIETAARLTAHAPGLTRILTHPITGTVLSVGRESYRPSAELRRWLHVRDGHCRFPGCGRPAARCDLDHTTAWAAAHGETRHDNLAHLCRAHHTLKHHSSWTAHQLDPTGTLIWRTPTGHIHVTEPAHRIEGVAESPSPGSAGRESRRRPPDSAPPTAPHVPSSTTAPPSPPGPPVPPDG